MSTTFLLCSRTVRDNECRSDHGASVNIILNGEALRGGMMTNLIIRYGDMAFR